MNYFIYDIWADINNFFLGSPWYDLFTLNYSNTARGAPDALYVYEFVAYRSSFFDPFIFTIISASGSWLWSVIEQGNYNPYGILIFIVLISIFLDYFILSEISAYNQKRKVQNPNNKFFAKFFIIWRIFLPDIFLASSISAFITKMMLSKKQILLLVVSAQIVRISFMFVLPYILGFISRIFS